MIAINIPADGLALAVLKLIGSDFSGSACRTAVSKYIGIHLENKPDIILLNVCYRRSLTPSDVFDSILYNIKTYADGNTVKILSPDNTQDVSPYFQSFFDLYRVLMRKGIDIYQYAADLIHQSGCQLWLSFRMNDHHYLDNPAVNSSFAMDDTIHATLPSGLLDYTLPAVQNYYLNYILEQAKRYAPDGIELDWLRSPGFLPKPMDQHCHILTQYHKELRQALDTLSSYCGKHIQMGVRVLSEVAQNTRNGYDVASWIADGTVDTVTVSNFYMPTNFEVPIDQWRRILPKKPYKLLCGCDWSAYCIPNRAIAMTPATVRGFISASIGRGADGAYLFNLFEEGNYTSRALHIHEDGTASVYDCFRDRLAAAAEPVDSVPRRHIHIGTKSVTDPPRYPLPIAAGTAENIAIYTGKAPNIYQVLIGCDTLPKFSIDLNGITADITFHPVPVWETGSLPEEVVLAPHQFAPYVFYADLPAGYVLDGENRITIYNNGNKAFHIEWFEIICQ